MMVEFSSSGFCYEVVLFGLFVLMLAFVLTTSKDTTHGFLKVGVKEPKGNITKIANILADKHDNEY